MKHACGGRLSRVHHLVASFNVAVFMIAGKHCSLFARASRVHVRVCATYLQVDKKWQDYHSQTLYAVAVSFISMDIIYYFFFL